jgi:mRNA interferase MazF
MPGHAGNISFILQIRYYLIYEQEKDMGITKELIKIFANWTKLKIKIHVSESNKNVYFKKGQIWWASIGQNIGVEANGKNENYERPIIILKKFNEHSFLGVVLFSKGKASHYYLELKDNHGVSSFANLSQIKLMSSKRLIRYVRDLPKPDLDTVKQKINKYL